MDDKSYFRIPKKWVRTGLVVAATAIVVAPLTAVASHSFTDVPDTNTFHGDIAWLADAGVTRGCNPPNNTEFCPDDPVTREQMAAFMRRFAEYLDAEDGTPAQADHATTANSATTADHANTADSANQSDDSDRLGGLAPSAYQTELAVGSDVGTIDFDDPAATLTHVTIDVPADGQLMLEYAVEISTDSPVGSTWIETGTSGCGAGFLPAPDGNAVAGTQAETTAVQTYLRRAVVDVLAGTHSYQVCGSDSLFTAEASAVNIGAVFSP